MNFKLPQLDLKGNKKQIMLSAALVSILALIVYFNFLLIPQVVRVWGAAAAAIKARYELVSARSDISRIQIFKDQIAAYKEKVDRYEKMLPAEQEIPSLLENLSTVAKSANVKIVGITPLVKKDDKAQKNQIYQEIPILISAKSGYHELGSFIASLEGGDRFIKVVDIQIKSARDAPKRHDVELLVMTYVLLGGK